MLGIMPSMAGVSKKINVPKQINEGDFPDYVHVMMAEKDAHLPDLARETATVLNENIGISTVVILRKELDLKAGFKKAKNEITANQFDLSDFDLSEHVNVFCGHDISSFYKFCLHVGISDAFVRKSKQPIGARRHIDGGTNSMNKDVSLKTSVTLTMSVNGGGTVLLPSKADDYTEITDQEGIRVYRHKEFENNKVTKNLGDGWQVPDGAIAIMKTARWIKPHLPQLHCAPPPKNHGLCGLFQPSEPRIVAMASSAGQRLSTDEDVVHPLFR